MKRLRMFTALIFVFAFVFGTPMLCAEGNAASSLQEQAETVLDKIPEELGRDIDAAIFQENGGVIKSFLTLIRNIFKNHRDILKAPLQLVIKITGAALLYAAFDFSNGQGTNRASVGYALNAALCLTVGSTLSNCLLSLVNGADSVVELTATAVESVVPVYSGIMVASGSITSAALFGFATAAAASVATAFIHRVITPLTGILLGLSLVSALCENNLNSLAEGIRKFVVRALGLFSAGFVSVLSLQSFVSGTTDSFLLKAARMVASSSVPIIGRTVSDAAVTLAGSLQIVKGTLGAACILLIAALLLPRILISMLSSVSLGFCVVCCDVLSLHGLARSLRTARAAADIVTAALTFYGLVLVICTAIMLRTGGV